MYRAVTLASLRAGANPRDDVAMAQLLEALILEMPPDRVVLGGEDVTALIRSSEVTAASGAIADSPVVRRHLVRLQRAIAADRNMVTEGRDQGTIVFPRAECKFFLVADPEERARRRQRDLAGQGELVALDEVLKAQQARDRRDQERDLAPMVPAHDALVLDSTGLSLAEVVSRMEQAVRDRSADSTAKNRSS